MFCQKCGMENKDGAAFCNSCGADLRIAPVTPIDPLMTGACEACGNPIKRGEKFCSSCLANKKHNDIIYAKIKTKEVEYENNNGYGPTILIIIGLFGLIWVFGIILIIIGVIWSYHCAGNRAKAIAEIDELEA